MKVADAHYCFRMDIVVNAGKSRKNVDAFVLLPPDAREAIDLLIDTRAQVGVPPSNIYIFARLNADSPMAGHVKLQELAQACGQLKFPKKITLRKLRTYIATVSQVWLFVKFCEILCSSESVQCAVISGMV